jgi:ribosomal protein L11 methyltransferase
MTVSITVPVADSTRARLACDEAAARRIAALIGESLPDDAIAAAFEADGGWAVEIHFRAPPDRDGVRALVEAAAGPAAAAALAFDSVAARDWVAASLAGLAPVRAGRFFVHGAHDRPAAPAGRIAIEIEAALAFGTGHHGTTRGCLLAFDALLKRRKLLRVLDLGTGTGVLAIAAARALHKRVLATDIDPVAVAVARANARHNGAGPQVMARRLAGTAGLVGHARFDLIFANILLGPLIRMAVPLAGLLAPNGRIVLSGLLAAQANAAIAVYRAQGLALERRITLEGWATLTLRRGRA